MLKGLKVNVADATFATGDKTALFEFSHPATEQTPALTDYRYIGDDPYNYVKFNCDNDGTNCEVWRIIGVFDVDDGNGNWEQRIKLVRGSAFAEEMQWDDRDGTWPGSGLSDWYGAKLNIFLNGDYLTRQGDASTFGLKELAQSQIVDAIYYLGSVGYKDDTTQKIYKAERGNTTCGECNNDISKLKWKGKVALMYPSDEYIVYANGVENECYNNPRNCLYSGITGSDGEGIFNHPETGWIYNSNVLEGQLNQVGTWFLSSSGEQILLAGSSHLSATRGLVESSVRPTVYLKSSINIISGEGTEQNPYTLSNS